MGAARMGAVRAAECWPVGMRGVGSIYRLFRRGRLASDDEVVVIFDPEDGRCLSVPLINVRHAVSRALRRGRLARTQADRIARAAEAMFYADRVWPEILSQAGVEDEEGRLAAYLKGFRSQTKRRPPCATPGPRMAGCPAGSRPAPTARPGSVHIEGRKPRTALRRPGRCRARGGPAPVRPLADRQRPLLASFADDVPGAERRATTGGTGCSPRRCSGVGGRGRRYRVPLDHRGGAAGAPGADDGETRAPGALARADM